MLCGVHRRFLPEYRCRVGCLWVAQINQIEQTRCFGGAYVECSGGVRGSVWFFLSLGLSSPSPVLWFFDRLYVGISGCLAPAPLSGARGASGIYSAKTQNAPLAPERGRGVWGEGASPPKTCGGSPLTSPPAAALQIHGHLCGLWCSLWFKKRASRSAFAGQNSGWKARATGRAVAGCCTPHPRPLSPFRGEGCQCDLHCNKNTKCSPRPRRGRGVGGEGVSSP